MISRLGERLTSAMRPLPERIATPSPDRDPFRYGLPRRRDDRRREALHLPDLVDDEQFVVVRGLQSG